MKIKIRKRIKKAGLRLRVGFEGHISRMAVACRWSLNLTHTLSLNPLPNLNLHLTFFSCVRSAGVRRGDIAEHNHRPGSCKNGRPGSRTSRCSLAGHGSASASGKTFPTLNPAHGARDDFARLPRADRGPTLIGRSRPPARRSKPARGAPWTRPTVAASYFRLADLVESRADEAGRARILELRPRSWPTRLGDVQGAVNTPALILRRLGRQDRKDTLPRCAAISWSYTLRQPVGRGRPDHSLEFSRSFIAGLEVGPLPWRAATRWS